MSSDRFVSNPIIPAPNQWQGSTRVGRMMSNCRPGKASEEAEIWNQQESTVPVAGAGVGKNTEWFLTSMSGHIPTKVIVVGHANAAGGQGPPPRTGDIVGTGEGVQTLTMTGAGARFNGRHVTPWWIPAPLFSPPCFISLHCPILCSRWSARIKSDL